MSRLTTISKTLVAFLFLAVSITSCSTDDDNSSPSGDNATFSAKVNGVDYNPPFKTAFLTTSINNILVSGETGNGEAIQLFIPGSITPGTYPFAQEGNTFVQAFYQETDSDALDGAFATSGSLTITAINTEAKEISGTFSFSGTVVNSGQEITVTEGQFDLTLEEI